jgi:uncharacterized NAD(P)/FAD-binding protein YdhS
VAIVGAGFSGTMVAVHLLRAGVPSEVVLVEARGRFGVGLAYGTDAPEHLTNVRASGMSPFPDRPAAFVEWLRGRNPAASPDTFAPRREYGAFLGEVLDRAASEGASRGATLRRVRGEAVAIDEEGAEVVVALASGERLRAGALVLATGNLPARDPLGPLRDAIPPGLYREAWSPGALDGLGPDAPVLLLGTGLTAVDVVLSLRRHGHVGRTLALSRRGLLPRRHPQVPPPPARVPPPDLREARSVRRLVRALRRAVAAEEAAGGDGRSVVDALRPQVQAIWASLPGRERERFLRHVRPFWDTHRHRMAPQVSDSIDTLLAVGAFEVRAGRVVDASAEAGLLRVRWRPRGSRETREIEVARVLDATGPSPDLRGRTTPLFRDLRERGVIRPDALGLGLDTAPDGAVLSREGTPSSTVFALGALRSGALWESTAVPELRVQARDLAARVLSAGG